MERFFPKFGFNDNFKAPEHIAYPLNDIAYPFNILYDLFFLSTFSIIIIPNPRRTKDNKDNKDNKTNPLSFILIRTFKTFYKILLFCGDKGNFCQYTAIGETRSTFECQ